MTRRRLAAGVAAALLWAPGSLLARPATAAEGFLGWDDLPDALDRPVRIPGFLHRPQTTRAALLPCLASVVPPPAQRLTLLLSPGALPGQDSDIMVLEASGRIEAHGADYAMAPESLRTLWRLPPSP